MRAHIGNDPGPNPVALARRSAAATPSVAVHLEASGPWRIIVVDGEMDVQVLPLLPDLRGRRAAHVVFDLKRVTFMDACALAAILDRRRRATLAGGCVRLVAPSIPVIKLLRLTGTSGLFLTFDTLEQVLSTPVPSPRTSTG